MNAHLAAALAATEEWVSPDYGWTQAEQAIYLALRSAEKVEQDRDALRQDIIALVAKIQEVKTPGDLIHFRRAVTTFTLMELSK